MTHRNILVTTIRIAAIFLLIRILENFPQQFFNSVALNSEYATTSFLVFTVFVPNLVTLIFAVLFWFFPNKLIRSIVPDSAQSEQTPEYFNSLNSALISAIGVYIIAFSLSDIIFYFSLKLELTNEFGSTPMQPVDQASFYATIAEVVIGLLLIIGNQGVSILIAKLRNR
ncbi:hypothetical protein [Aliikangiella sp. G2MR2-5]|uniref:hypothetical protein n=1 Tax=Aliikangiella sp. G2MR2-5 TaxID=2788943 RepID=UPI0018AA5AC2|nr:hypothetical protein [Aliikangiella sp. G2MR2-5]